MPKDLKSAKEKKRKERPSKILGAGVIIENDEGKVLFFLRDNKSTIPFPNQWSIPGGHVEQNESPMCTVKRELKEEMELEIGEISFFGTIKFDNREIYIFHKRLNVDIEKTPLHEGQCIAFFDEDEIKKMDLAYNQNGILSNFFEWRRQHK